MITLFSEEVDITSTNSDRNTIFVESFEEVFFGVYEFEINGNVVIAEKVDSYELDPVVAIPVVEADGSKTNVEFVLKRGSFEVQLGTGEAVLTESPIEVINDGLIDVVVEAKTSTASDQQQAVNISYQLDKEDVIKEIKTDIDATLAEIRLETSQAVSDVDRLRDEIFIEFTSNSDNYRAKESEKLRAFVAEKLSEVDADNKVVAEELELKLANTLDSEFKGFVKKVRDTQQELKKRALENRKIAASITALEEGQIELNNELAVNKEEILEATESSQKSVNKALSRLGTVKKELTVAKQEFDILKEAWANDVNMEEVKAIRESAEQHVKAYFSNKIEQVKEVEIDKLKKEEIFEALNESKESILEDIKASGMLKREVRKLTKEVTSKVNTDTVTESEVRKIAGEIIALTVHDDKESRITQQDVHAIVNEAVKAVVTKQPIIEQTAVLDPTVRKSITENLKLELDNRFGAEMQTVKRMIELAGGGGGFRGIEDAPLDGQTYVRENGEWVIGTGGGGGGAVNKIVAGDNVSITPSTGVSNVTVNAVNTGSDVSTLSSNWEDTYNTVSTKEPTWDDTTTTVAAYSAAWGIDNDNVGSDVSTISGNWQGTYTTVQANSASWGIDTAGSYVGDLSSNWQDTYTTVDTKEGTWDAAASTVTAKEGNWDGAYTTVQANSAAWGIDTAGSYVGDLSSNWQEAYDTTSALSAAWISNYRTTNNLSADWSGAYTTVNANSATWLTEGGSDVSTISANWEGTYDTVSDLSSNWSGVYSTVQTNSASWTGGGGGGVTEIVAGSNITISQGTGQVTINATADGIGSDVSTISANWENTYNTVDANSTDWDAAYTAIDAKEAIWDSTNSTMTQLSSDWQGTFTTVNSNSATWESAYTTTQTKSANWDTAYNTVDAKEATWDGTTSTVQANSASWGASAPVDSVNTKTGAVVIDPDDLDDSSTTNKFTTAADILKLSNIEDNATADQTDAEIQTAVASSDLDMGGNKVLFSNVYATTGDLPSATNNHGMFAHVHATGKGYFAHGGNWIELANASDITAGGSDVSSLSSNWEGTYSTVSDLSSSWSSAYEQVSALSAQWGGGTYDSNLGSDIAMTEDVGGLTSGTTVASLTGSTFSQLFDSLLFPTVDPVVGSNNSTGLSDNVSGLQTIGATINITLTTTASLGTLRLNGVTQDVYAGDVTSAAISGPNSTSYNPSVGPGGTDIDNQVVTGHVVTEGTNQWTMTTTFGQGPMPLDSAGNDFPSIRFAAGGTKSNSTSFEGVYPIRLGLATGSSNFEDRSLTSHSSNNIEVSQDYTETSSLRHRIAIPNDMIDSSTVGWQQWNTVSSSYSDIAASSFTSSSVTETIEGNTVNYTLYTKTGPPGGGDVSGQPIYRITFS